MGTYAGTPQKYMGQLDRFIQCFIIAICSNQSQILVGYDLMSWKGYNIQSSNKYIDILHKLREGCSERPCASEKRSEVYCTRSLIKQLEAYLQWPF